MANIEYLRKLHHKKLTVKRTQFHVKEFFSYEKGPRFLVLRKGHDLHLLRSRKEPGLWMIYNAW